MLNQIGTWIGRAVWFFCQSMILVNLFSLSNVRHSFIQNFADETQPHPPLGTVNDVFWLTVALDVAHTIALALGCVFFYIARTGGSKERRVLVSLACNCCLMLLFAFGPARLSQKNHVFALLFIVYVLSAIPLSLGLLTTQGAIIASALCIFANVINSGLSALFTHFGYQFVILSACALQLCAVVIVIIQILTRSCLTTSFELQIKHRLSQSTQHDDRPEPRRKLIKFTLTAQMTTLAAAYASAVLWFPYSYTDVMKGLTPPPGAISVAINAGAALGWVVTCLLFQRFPFLSTKTMSITYSCCAAFTALLSSSVTYILYDKVVATFILLFIYGLCIASTFTALCFRYNDCCCQQVGIIVGYLLGQLFSAILHQTFSLDAVLLWMISVNSLVFVFCLCLMIESLSFSPISIYPTMEDVERARQRPRRKSTQMPIITGVESTPNLNSLIKPPQSRNVATRPLIGLSRSQSAPLRLYSVAAKSAVPEDPTC